MSYGKKHAQWENKHLTNHNRDPPTIPLGDSLLLPPDSRRSLSILVTDPSISCAIASPQMKLSCSFYKCVIHYVQFFQEEAQSLETLGSDLHRQVMQGLVKALRGSAVGESLTALLNPHSDRTYRRGHLGAE